MATDATSFAEIEAFIESAVRKDPHAFVLPEAVIGAMERIGVAPAEIDRIVGAAELRANPGHPGMLTCEASERAARLAHVVGLAHRVFGSAPKAFKWLRTRNAQLAKSAPLDCVNRESGARMVRDILIRIDHGIAA